MALFAVPLSHAVAQTSVTPVPPASATGEPPMPLLPPLPVTSGNDSSADDDTLAERLLVSPREPRCDDNGMIGGITVCGKKKDNSKDRLPITSELNSATVTADGLPRAPDIMGNRITGKSIHFGCFIGGCPQAMLPDINFALIPPAPAGSDADLIGRGVIRGN